MWLINTTCLSLEFIEDHETCIYAILSHTWADGEVSFQDMTDLERARKKLGFSKIERTCQLARDRNIEYAWVDTCCIDKSSSAELTEAINSMFRWYKQSHICFVFLSDLLSIDQNRICDYLPHCRWFTRGWTLQELIAPEEIEFYDRGWNMIGTDDSLRELLSKITGIDAEILDDSDGLKTVCVARRMSWASARQTTRVEDLAYCLFGLFDVHLPLIYGEGRKAFIRLQEAIARENNDLSLFAWSSQNENMLPPHRLREFRGILAESPAEFRECGTLQNISDPSVLPAEVSITSQGFLVTDRLSDGKNEYLMNLDCNVSGPDGVGRTIAIRLVRTAHGYVRHRSDHLAVFLPHASTKSTVQSLPIPKTLSAAESRLLVSTLRDRFSFDISTNISFLGYKIQRKPLHLWDHATKTFITDSYATFTGIIEIDTTGNIQKEAPNPEHLFRLSTSSAIIFGFRNSEKMCVNPQLLGFHNSLEPWAGIYSLRGKDKMSSALSSALSREKTLGFPYVAREAREIVLSEGIDSWLLAPTCEHIAVLSGPRGISRDASEDDRPVTFTLSMALEETSNHTIYRLKLSIEW